MLSFPPARLVTGTIAGPSGPLEALLRIPPDPVGVAIVAHPHPLHGGTMHTKVVHRAARLLCDRFHLLAVRFNFRGVGASAGVHDGGRGEVDDLIAAARFAREQVPRGALVVAGFSFGSLCAIRSTPTIRPDALLLMGVPLDRWNQAESVLTRGRNVAWVQGGEDPFGDGQAARTLALHLPWNLRVVEGADHFFTDQLDEMEVAAVEGLSWAFTQNRAGAVEEPVS